MNKKITHMRLFYNITTLFVQVIFVVMLFIDLSGVWHIEARYLIIFIIVNTNFNMVTILFLLDIAKKKDDNK